MHIMWKTGLAFLGVLLIGWLAWVQVSKPDSRLAEVAEPSDSYMLQQGSGSLGDGSAKDLGTAQTAIEVRLLSELDRLKSVNGESAGQVIIQGLFSWLRNQESLATVSAVESILSLGVDGFAFGRFSPGARGFLDTYPTFRTALLDILEELDPDRAVTVGKGILNTSASADEWAISLRTLSKHASAPEDKRFLENKVSELLEMHSWLEEPTFGYLHAFDAAVAGGHLAGIVRLGEIVANPPNRAISHAATISVDRFFQIHPSVGSGYLIRNPEFLKNEPGFRATLLARINPMDVDSINLVENYLENHSFGSSEKRTFISNFPNFNSTYSYNLITGSLLYSRSDMRERSIAAHVQMSKWLAEDTYPEFEDVIASRVNRLASDWKL